MADLSELYFEMLESCSGTCIDFSHWKDAALSLGEKGNGKMEKIAKKYKIGCCHISAVSDKIRNEIDCITGQNFLCCSAHWMDKLSQLDYIKDYVQYLPEYVSIELENSFEKQLEVKEYLEKIINK